MRMGLLYLSLHEWRLGWSGSDSEGHSMVWMQQVDESVQMEEFPSTMMVERPQETLIHPSEAWGRSWRPRDPHRVRETHITTFQ